MRVNDADVVLVLRSIKTLYDLSSTKNEYVVPCCVLLEFREIYRDDGFMVIYRDDGEWKIKL
jgi:hypothetical protein